MTNQFDPIDEAHRQWVDHGWVSAADGMAAITSLARTYQQVMGKIDSILKPFRLTFARFEVLRLLSFTRSHRMTMGRMGELLQVHPASVTNAVERLERDGLVTRIVHPDDGRSKLATLLPAGADLVEAATVELNAYFASLDLDHQTLRALLAAVSATAE